MRPFYATHAISRLSSRWFVSTARNTERERAASTTSSSQDDYYALLLAEPTPNPSGKSSKRFRAPKASNPSSSSSVPPPTAATTNPQPPPDSRILFSAPLAGPSARMRGLARGEQGLGKPPEPDNCCMSGCVNCVWDAYREEIEEWAAGRKRREAEMGRGAAEARQRADRAQKPRNVEEGPVGDLDEVGALGSYEGVDLDDEGGLFEGVPVGIREFMKHEKRIRERKAQEDS